MKHLIAAAMLAGTVLVAGCSASHEGISLSENKFIDNNCSGNGWLTNDQWCSDGLHPSAGPWAGM